MEMEINYELLNAETPQRQDLIRRINHTLNKIRPYLQADGGDVEFVDYKDGVCSLAMVGACAVSWPVRTFPKGYRQFSLMKCRKYMLYVCTKTIRLPTQTSMSNDHPKG